MKVFIIYDSKYGNTKNVAERILEGIKQVEGIEVEISYATEVDPKIITSYDALIIGAPNHMASPSLTMKKFVDKLDELNLNAKNVAVFGTYSGRARVTDRAVKKMEKIVGKTLPNLNLLQPSLSVKVKGVTGPVAGGELPKCLDFGKRIGNKLKNPKI
jgi:flavorubredoxin